jgi:DNA-binding CsgD family transcriptional regulator
MPTPIDIGLVEHTYGVPLGETTWQGLLAGLAREIDADCAVLMSESACCSRPAKTCLWGRDGAVWETYASEFAAVDPFSQAIRSGRVPTGTVLAEREIIAADTLYRTAFYHEFWRPNGIGYALGAHVSDRRDTRFHALLTRPLSKGPFTCRDTARLQAYLRHVFRAMRLESALSFDGSAPDLDAFARRYRLTCAELRLVGLLLEAGDLRESAHRLSRSYHTLRAQLRSIMAKTDTHSQLELMALLYRPAGARSPEESS